MKLYNIFIHFITLISVCLAASSSNYNNVRWAGFRYSTIGTKRSFGYVPNAMSIKSYIQKIKSNFNENTKGILLLTVGTVSENKCILEFPKPNNVTDFEDIMYSTKDRFEEILSGCDEADINVWLVVEPGNNNIVNLANIVLDKYGSHKSVKGFGVDLEWYYNNYYRNGKSLTDYEAKEIVDEIHKKNNNYTFLIKHWSVSHMPEHYNTDMIFVNTSQYYNDISEMTKELSAWAKSFPKNPVMFEIGFEVDKEIWENEPIKVAKSVADVTSKSNSQVGIIWVDYTMKEALMKM
ncbi:hypothetical protein PIROE2DRAFT_16876 [Piromyces sp. E2]|nr:hypothetical protein PIROE2DRAFT_16876 [Piromyces sp. E2]|eukprot:OUM57969.1 hypothetical protein PIROE2DRAFT_16876 [Piromyces sp. E2]